MKTFGKIILWLLFWYYLIPYYLLKRYVFHGKKQVVWSSIASIALVFIAFVALIANTPDEDENAESASKPKVHYIVKKVGRKRLAQAKAKNKLLVKEEAKKEAEYEKLKDELDSQKKQEHEQKEKAEEAATKQKAAENRAARKAAKQRKEASENKSDDSDSDSGGGAGRGGDMNTADSGKIVGNRNSHIYHVPGQTGYRMNSANAVYFDSEQDAVNAGYRKAKR